MKNELLKRPENAGASLQRIQQFIANIICQELLRRNPSVVIIVILVLTAALSIHLSEDLCISFYVF